MKDLFSKEALILSGMPILAFMCVLAFEVGYADAFGFSVHFVEIDLKTIIVAMFVLCLVLYPVYLYFETAGKLLLSENRINARLGLTLIMPIPLLILVITSGFRTDIVYIGVATMIMAILILIAEYLLKVPGHGWKKAWRLWLKVAIGR
jgi:hypothetical protein